MATRAETRVVYAAGAAQGIVLVTFPAASTIFTSPQEYDLSNTQYGVLFLPQVATAITASLLGAWLGRRFDTKRVYLAGLGAGLVSMSLLLVSAFFESDTSVAFPLLLLATTFLGVGFGLTVPALNTLTAAFHPRAVDSSVLVLNALLGLGTALAPVLVAIFIGLGFWWGLPVLSGALLYGVCETINGNWSQLDMTSELGASTTVAALALTAFWSMVTVGRILVVAVERWVPVRVTFHVLPFVVASAFVVISVLGEGGAGLGIVAFGLAGLGCSALLPLTISFGQVQLAAISAAMAGGVIAFYQVGYGIAAFGTGPLLDNGVALSRLYAISAAIAAAMGLLSFAVARPVHAHHTVAGPVEGPA